MNTLLKSVLRTVLLGVRDLLDPLFHFQEVSILAYHSISDASVDTAVSSEAFCAQLSMLHTRGYKFVSLEAIEAWQEGNGLLPHKCVAITFDDGYADFETTALPLLKEFNAPVTLFVVGDFDALRKVLKDIGSDTALLDFAALERVRTHSLVSIEYHSRAHANLQKLSENALSVELVPPFPTSRFAYAGGNYTSAAIEKLKELGYVRAYSIKPGLVTADSNPYLMPRSVITKDMELSHVRFFATTATQWYRILRSVG